MGAVASGRIKAGSLSREEARKFLHESKGTYGKLPDKVNMKMDKSGDKSFDSDADEKAAGMRGKFGKDTYANKGGKKPPPKKGKKMSRADFLKMVREKKYKKK
jgi:hypothetical protein